MTRSVSSLPRSALASLVRAALLSLFTTSLASATTCVVSDNSDDPGDGSTTGASHKVTNPDNPATWQFDAGQDGVVTLRDCIVAANLLTGSTGIPSGFMNIDLGAMAGQKITLGSSLPLIFNNTTIDGGSGDAVTIDGGGTYRIFFVSGLPDSTENYNNTGVPDPDGAQPIDVTLINLRLADGKAQGGTGSSGGMGAGGALFVNRQANVTLVDVGFSGNSAAGGGGGTSQTGGGGMGAAANATGGAGLGAPSTTEKGGAIGSLTGSLCDAYSCQVGGLGGGFGGTGLGQISVAQNFGTGFQRATGFSGPGGGIGAGGGPQGGFGGGGGYGYYSHIGGNGGFGGGGGFTLTAGMPGGAGGFGAGGGGTSAAGTNGGVGGFGGGGGGGGTSSASGGVGAGAASGVSGGGGAAFGGAVFVRSGAGYLTIQATRTLTELQGNSVTGGIGGNNGAAAGPGLFLMSGTTAAIEVGDGQTYTISDSIGDDSQATLPGGQSYTPGCALAFGCGARLGKTGAGTLVLAGTHTFADSTTIVQGTLQLDGTLTTSQTSVTGSGSISGILGGTGTAADVVLLAGGVIAPGSPAANGGAGTLTMHDLTWNSGGTIAMQLSHDSGSVDLVATNQLLAGSAGSHRFKTIIAASKPQVGDIFTLVQCSSSCTGLTAADLRFDGTSTVTGTFSVETNALKLTVDSVVDDRIFFDNLE